MISVLPQPDPQDRQRRVSPRSCGSGGNLAAGAAAGPTRGATPAPQHMPKASQIKPDNGHWVGKELPLRWDRHVLWGHPALLSPAWGAQRENTSPSSARELRDGLSTSMMASQGRTAPRPNSRSSEQQQGSRPAKTLPESPQAGSAPTALGVPARGPALPSHRDTGQAGSEPQPFGERHGAGQGSRLGLW